MSTIQNEQVKESLLKAESFMEQEKYLEAIYYATYGLEMMFKIAGSFFFEPSYFRFDPSMTLNELDSINSIYVEKSSNKPEVSSKLKGGIQALRAGVQNLVERINKLDETTICYCLGINMEQYVRYRKMVGYVGGFTSSGKVYLKSGIFSKEKFDFDNFDKKDAEVSLDYCTKTIMNIKETLERLNKPLSEE